MKTGCFFHYQGPGRVSIARRAPPQLRQGLRVYRPLAPASAEMLAMSYPQYREQFMRQLERLNAQQVSDDLHRLVDPHEPVLLCWEDLTKPGQWCHRRMVADWFQDRLGVEVRELEIGPHDERQQELF